MDGTPDNEFMPTGFDPKRKESFIENVIRFLNKHSQNHFWTNTNGRIFKNTGLASTLCLKNELETLKPYKNSAGVITAGLLLDSWDDIIGKEK